tara:strand:- start:51 stop:257 length:207 start_codon:yes stop_codon:yes gene_type:complete
MAHVKVYARRNETNERLIKRFSSKVKKSGLMEELRNRRFFVKPSKIRRLKKLRRKRITRKLNEKSQKG